MRHQIAEDFFRGGGGEKCYLHPLLSEFLMLWRFGFFARLAGVHSPVACTALPSPRSSIIYGAQARKCPQILTHFDFLSAPSPPPNPNHTDLKELLTGSSAVTPSVLGVSASPQPPLTSLTPPPPPPTAALTPGLSRLQVSRGHEGAGCCTEQLKQIWAKKSRMAPAGSASSTSPATSSFATTSAGYATSTSASFSNATRIVSQGLCKLIESTFILKVSIWRQKKTRRRRWRHLVLPSFFSTYRDNLFKNTNIEEHAVFYGSAQTFSHYLSSLSPTQWETTLFLLWINVYIFM